VRTLGVDIGGTSVKWVVLEHDPTPRVVSDGQLATEPERGPGAVIDRIAALARELGSAEGGLQRVGLGMPGPLDLERGRTVFLGNFPGWEDYAVVEPLERELGLPVALINDARAFTLAELELGAGRGCSTLVAITIGTGIGGGVVVDGRLLLHLNGTVGELGHQTLDPEGPPCGCGNNGCLETFSAGPAIARAADMATPELVFEAARAGDRRAADVLARAGKYLGIGIANVAVIVGPERVVVGGGVAAAGELMLEPARRELARRLTVIPPDLIPIVPAELGLRGGAIGAALWATRVNTNVSGPS
jgi:glucokinase